MERLAAKKGQGVLDVLRTSKDKGELKRAIQTWKDTDGQEGPAASEEEILSADESISFDEKRRKRAPKRAEFEPSNVASISDTGDLNAVDYLNPPETSGPSELKATTAEERADLEKKYGSWRAAKEAIKAEGDRYRAALQPKKGFEEQYDADVKFQEEEYGGGSLERDRLVAEIAGYDYVDKSGRQQRARGEDEDLYEKYYFEAQEDTPWAQKEALQDAALKGVREHRARKSELRIDKILRESDVEATEDVGARFEEEDTLAELEAEEAERLKKEKAGVVTSAVQKAKETGPGGTGTRRQPTDTERAAKKALGKTTTDEVEETTTDEVEETTTDEVIEDTVDETSTEESIDAAARKEQAKDSKEATEREALDAGFANVRMPGLRKQSSELYNSFDKAYSSMYPSQEEMNQYPGARGRLIKRRNALDTVKNKLFRSSPDQWGNRPYGIGMNLDDAIQVLENELPTATKEIKEMARRMRGFHILMNRYGEDAQLKGASDLENLLRNTRLRGDKPPEESPSEDLIASGAIPQETLNKYPMAEDVDDDFTGLTVSADYDTLVDIPEGKEFSYTIFPRNYNNLPIEQQYEYVVMTDGTKYLYKTDPEDLGGYLDPVEVSEITELSPSESIIASAAAGE